MALKTSKITSEIIQTCNRFLSSNAELLSANKLSATLNTGDESYRPHRPFRYKIANTEKPQGLPQLTFRDEDTTLFAELQPSADPEFRFEQVPQKWVQTASDNSPFPKSIKQISDTHVTYSDKQKADDKFVKFKMSSFMPTSRHFSTVTSSLTRQYSRSPADNSSAGNCKGKLSKCVKVKRKDCKVGSKGTCPKHLIKDCELSKGSKCERYYLNPHCVKKFAPYPSYSEACAEHLPENPSECEQCPWRTCDDADTIVPGKPVRSKRHYSTCCHRHLETMNGIVSPHLPPLSTVQEYICDRKCGKSKPPCKEPLGPCEERKQKQKHDDKMKRSGGSGSTKKKAADMEERMILSSYINGAEQNTMINPYTLEPVRISLNSPLPNTSSWIDIFEGPEAVFGEKRKWPNCDHKKKPKAPKRNKNKIDDEDKPVIIEYGDVDWWSGRGKKTVVTPPVEVTKKTWKKKNKIKDRLHNRVTKKLYKT